METFRSFQGEGLFAGAPQVFLRLAGCHLRCNYCDTPESWTRASAREVDAAALVGEIRSLAVHPTHSISVTGGEPLLQADLLDGILDDLRAIRPVHVDTSGTLVEPLERLIDRVDTVALDIKLPSTPGVRVSWEAIEASLALSARRDSFVKVVLLDSHPDADVDRAAEAIARAAPRLPVFLQPVTPFAGTRPPGAEALRRHRDTFAKRGLWVRVQPQLHVMVGWK